MGAVESRKITERSGHCPLNELDRTNTRVAQPLWLPGSALRRTDAVMASSVSRAVFSHGFSSMPFEPNLERCRTRSRNVQKLEISASPGHKMKPCGLHVLLEKRMVAEIDHYRVKTPLEPTIRRRPDHAGSATRKAHGTTRRVAPRKAGRTPLSDARGPLPRSHIPEADRQSALVGDLPDSTRCSLDPPDAANPGILARPHHNRRPIDSDHLVSA